MWKKISRNIFKIWLTSNQLSIFSLSFPVQCYTTLYSSRCDLLISDKFCCTFLHSFEKIETEKWPFLFIISLFFSIFMTFSWLHPQFLAVNGRKLLTVLIETINLTFWSKKVKIFKIYGFFPYKSTFWS